MFNLLVSIRNDKRELKMPEDFNKTFILLLIIFLLINISFISASQKYTLKVTDEHPFFVMVSSSADENSKFVNDMQDETNIINDFNEETNIINVMHDKNRGGSESDKKKGEEINDKTNGTWKTASELNVGDFLITDDGKKAKITSVKKIEEDVEVYNLESAIFNDYIVEGDVVVHNSNTYALKGGYAPKPERVIPEGELRKKGEILPKIRPEELPEDVKNWLNRRNLAEDYPNEVAALSDTERWYYAEVVLKREFDANGNPLLERALTDSEAETMLEMHYAENGDGLIRILGKVRKREESGNLPEDLRKEWTRVWMDETNQVTGKKKKWGYPEPIKSPILKGLESVDNEKLVEEIVNIERKMERLIQQYKEELEKDSEYTELSKKIKEFEENYFEFQLSENPEYLELMKKMERFQLERTSLSLNKEQILSKINQLKKELKLFEENYDKNELEEIPRYKELNYELSYLNLILDFQDKANIYFLKNKGLIVSIASEFFESARKLGVETEELIQEGYLGILGPIFRNFDPSRGFKFSTYVYDSLRNLFNKYLARQHDIAFPISEAYHLVVKAMQNYPEDKMKSEDKIKCFLRENVLSTLLDRFTERKFPGKKFEELPAGKDKEKIEKAATSTLYLAYAQYHASSVRMKRTAEMVSRKSGEPINLKDACSINPSDSASDKISLEYVLGTETLTPNQREVVILALGGLFSPYAPEMTPERVLEIRKRLGISETTPLPECCLIAVEIGKIQGVGRARIGQIWEDAMKKIFFQHKYRQYLPEFVQFIPKTSYNSLDLRSVFKLYHGIWEPGDSDVYKKPHSFSEIAKLLLNNEYKSELIKKVYMNAQNILIDDWSKISKKMKEKYPDFNSEFKVPFMPEIVGTRGSIIDKE